MTKHRFRVLAASTAVLALLGAACGDDDDTATTDDTEADADQGGEGGGGATFEFIPLDVGGPNTKAALEKGDIDIAVLFSSDGAIAANDWVALEDDKDLQPVDNFVPAVNTEAATPEVTAVLDAVSAALTVEAMQEMVAAVSIDGENPADVATEFLADVDVPSGVSGDLTVGSANFAESEVTAEIYAQALESAGGTIEKKLQFGARETYIPALSSGELDVVPEFVGTLAYYFDENAEVTSDLDESVELARGLAAAEGLTLLAPGAAASINTFVVTQETAEEHGLATVSDLAGVDEALVLGGPPECPSRPPCLLGLIEVYGLQFDV
ncbi:MAG: glycine betaine ABC transporter substrate-binding protein [Acidimicrobiales bacterium]|nr:glycine betaine ABC transporter substrate-binding protein [Acidimicrobiales bacterium]